MIITSFVKPRSDRVMCWFDLHVFEIITKPWIVLVFGFSIWRSSEISCILSEVTTTIDAVYWWNPCCLGLCRSMHRIWREMPGEDCSLHQKLGN
jgi:hypothetical protein